MTPSWSRVARAGLFAVAYFAFAEGGHLLSFQPSAFATFWPPSGLYLAALLLTERRTWPLLLLGGLAANLTSDVLVHDKTLPVSLAFAAGNALEALAGAWLLQRFAGTPFTLNRVKNVLALATLPALLSTTLSATVGATTIWATLGEVNWMAVWFVWWSAVRSRLWSAHPQPSARGGRAWRRSSGRCTWLPEVDEWSAADDVPSRALGPGCAAPPLSAQSPRRPPWWGTRGGADGGVGSGARPPPAPSC